MMSNYHVRFRMRNVKSNFNVHSLILQSLSHGFVASALLYEMKYVCMV